jgi:hypothetical protein
MNLVVIINFQAWPGPGTYGKFLDLSGSYDINKAAAPLTLP